MDHNILKPARLRIGSLCSGYGGLDRAVENFYDAETAWFSEFDAAPSKILAYRWPGVPNLGDMTKIDWASTPDVDIICGGTPCQDLSGAGKRAGMTDGTRSNLWVQMREAIAIKRPALVVWENVRGAYSANASCGLESCEGCVGDPGVGGPFLRALGRVLGDLSELGYDTEWVGLRASDAGAPHARFRVFVVAYDPKQRLERFGSARNWRPRSEPSDRGPADAVAIFPTSGVADATGGHASRSGTRSDEPLLPGLARLFPTPRASDGDKGGPNQRGSKGDLTMASAVQLFPTPDASVANDGEGLATWLERRERVKLTAQNGNGMGMPIAIAALQFCPVADLMPTPTVQDASNNGGPSQFERNTLPLNTEVSLLPTPRSSRGASNTETLYALGGVRDDEGDLQGNVILEPAFSTSSTSDYEALWDSLEDQSPFWVTDRSVDYWPAISRWAEVMGRKSPSPTLPDGKGGKHRLNAKFTEWLMGQPAGWITSPEIGLTRNEQLKAGGNGVVTQQCELALAIAWPRVLEQLARAA
ncbi:MULTISPECIES: DNA cytosine methyltransferase [unclassified Cryobacterium]|uniref:DNA cytosine methyltransferase n=1 Tax=unclassified Cryobacterium TaxID=2649013 RepID=UPI00106D58DF|nr:MULTISPECIES: DNA (cytosine-5-)-methyltransferase [unclassified Cryobacterium]TFC59447.1 DNA (cytosine-5-)-methyltransferase [Cryobacterium sp. TMB3-1-2]TFC67243.1 DNA (cytosine-5-)-methyltransferase [Cryobacterium sp. TMB3-15]TFC73244.1 DNA (cytosine-5-)-methyltransferase [Cryobacterium sp. TMB3-10]TFD46132.1 DNA (cytosine-5-)-methyltransferase [Cryobacterium sp. TMB3-12]